MRLPRTKTCRQYGVLFWDSFSQCPEQLHTLFPHTVGTIPNIIAIAGAYKPPFVIREWLCRLPLDSNEPRFPGNPNRRLIFSFTTNTPSLSVCQSSIKHQQYSLVTGSASSEIMQFQGRNSPEPQRSDQDANTGHNHRPADTVSLQRSP